MNLSVRDFLFAGPEVESPNRYQLGGYHPVHIGDFVHERYRVIHKLGFGTFSTVWLARDLQPAVQIRYVALKFVTADLTGKNNEIKIYQHLASQSPSTHPGSGHVPTLLDHFRVHGVNGEHDVLVLQVLGPDLETMFDEIEPSVVEQSIKSLTHQVALGASFLHHCGVVHGDLHLRNVALVITGLDGESERKVMNRLGFPDCVPVFTLDHRHQTDALPKYLVIPGSMFRCVDQNDMRIKIVDFGEAFFCTEPPRFIRTPLQVRPPEAIFNRLLKQPRITYSTQVDTWSLGCIICELATARSMLGYTWDEAKALRVLMNLNGPLPQDWIDSLGASFFAENNESLSLEQKIQWSSRIDDKSGLTALLQKLLTLDPLERPTISQILDHPWFGSSSCRTTSLLPQRSDA